MQPQTSLPRIGLYWSPADTLNRRQRREQQTLTPEEGTRQVSVNNIYGILACILIVLRTCARDGEPRIVHDEVFTYAL